MASIPIGKIFLSSTRGDPGTMSFLNLYWRLTDNLTSNPKLFADDNLFFPVVHDINQFGFNLNDDLENITNWAFQWKMSIDPDTNK